MLAREVRQPVTLIAVPPEEENTNLIRFNLKFQDNLRSAHEKIRAATQVSAEHKNRILMRALRLLALRPDNLSGCIGQNRSSECNVEN